MSRHDSLCVLLVLFVFGSAAGARPDVRYRIAVDPDSRPARWLVEVEIDEIAAGDRLRLQDWGEWTRVDPSYLVDLESKPAIRRDPDDPQCFLVDAPRRWNGSVRLRFAIPTIEVGTSEYERHGLLPAFHRGERWMLGYSANTLIDVVRADGTIVFADRTLELIVPPDWTIVSGWGGVSKHRQRVTIAQDADNTLFAFGKPSALHRGSRRGVTIEIAQFGDGADVTPTLFDLAARLVPEYGENTGRRIDRPVRFVVTKAGSGGNRTDGAICIRSSAMDPAEITSPYTVHFIAHESFHDWLGGFLTTDDDSLVWFVEGFTDYVSLWHCASIGLVEREWFAERILRIEEELRQNPVFGKVSFADRSVRWREGANEEVAYKGGCLLAFHLDVALREQGRTGVIELISDLLKEDGGVYAPESIERWLASKGLEEFHGRHVVGRELPPAAAALTRVGFSRSRVDATLTYFGIETDSGVDWGTVVSIDPDGPAATVDVQPGDSITGYFPTRARPPRIAESVVTRYRFGLDRFEPNQEGTYIGRRRGEDDDRRIDLQPRVIPGGYHDAMTADPERTAAFFRFAPR